jgi:hypothetical protein
MFYSGFGLERFNFFAFEFFRVSNLRLLCLTPLSTIFQLYRGRQVLLVEKTTDKVTDQLYHIILYRIHLAMSKIQTHNVS